MTYCRLVLALAIITIASAAFYCPALADCTDPLNFLAGTLYWKCNSFVIDVSGLTADVPDVSDILDESLATWQSELNKYGSWELYQPNFLLQCEENQSTVAHFQIDDTLSEADTALAGAFPTSDYIYPGPTRIIVGGTISFLKESKFPLIGKDHVRWTFADEPNQDPTLRNVSFHSVLTHEIGHLLGSGHTEIVTDSCTVGCGRENPDDLPTMVSGETHCRGAGMFEMIDKSDPSSMTLAQTLAAADKEFIQTWYFGRTDVLLEASRITLIDNTLYLDFDCDQERPSVVRVFVAQSADRRDAIEVVPSADLICGGATGSISATVPWMAPHLYLWWSVAGGYDHGPVPVRNSGMIQRPGIFPNPVMAGGVVQFGDLGANIPAATLKVYDIAGRLLSTSTLDVSNGESSWKVLDDRGSPLRRGIYWISIGRHPASSDWKFRILVLE